MKTQKDINQKPTQKSKPIIEKQKISSCCSPTCCGGSDDNKNINRKDK